MMAAMPALFDAFDNDRAVGHVSHRFILPGGMAAVFPPRLVSPNLSAIMHTPS